MRQGDSVSNRAILLTRSGAVCLVVWLTALFVATRCQAASEAPLPMQGAAARPSSETAPLFGPAAWKEGPYSPTPRLAPSNIAGWSVTTISARGWEDAPRDEAVRLPPPPLAIEELEAIPPAEAITPDPKPPVRAGGSGGGVGGPFAGKAPFTMRGFWAPATDVRGQDATLGMNMEGVNVGFPLLKPKPGQGIWLGIANFSRLELATAATLPGASLAVPNQLWSLQVGTMHTRQFESGWTAGGMFLFGSASDRPFAALRDMTLTAALFANRPARNQRDAWNFSLFYSPTSQLPYPLPGMAYVWRPSPKVEASIGLPASLRYMPNEQFSLLLTYVPLTNFGARAEHRFQNGWSLYSAYQVYNETYFLADRVDTQERFYVFDQRVSVGVERGLWRGLAVDCSVLYMFDRQIFQGVNFSSNRVDVLRFDPGVGLNAQLLWRR